VAVDFDFAILMRAPLNFWNDRRPLMTDRRSKM
jgi:hypothetical protein